MIEVMMGNDHFRQRLIRYKRASFVDISFRIGFTAVRFKHRQVVVEFKYRGISPSASQIPNSFGDRHRFDLQPWRSWSRRGSHGFGSGHNGDRSIDNVLVNVQFVPDDVSEIDRGVIAGGQRESLFNLVTGEMRS